MEGAERDRGREIGSFDNVEGGDERISRVPTANHKSMRITNDYAFVATRGLRAQPRTNGLIAQRGPIREAGLLESAGS